MILLFDPNGPRITPLTFHEMSIVERAIESGIGQKIDATKAGIRIITINWLKHDRFEELSLLNQLGTADVIIWATNH